MAADFQDIPVRKFSPDFPGSNSTSRRDAMKLLDSKRKTRKIPDAMAMGYYQLSKGSSGKFRFNLLAANHEIILSSEAYETKNAAESGIASVQKNGQDDAHFDKRLSSASQPYFVLKAGNGAIIGTSEMYTSDAGRDNGIESVKKNSPSTDIRDLTS